MRKAVCILWDCAALTFGCIDPIAAVRGPDRSGVKLLQPGMSLGYIEQLIGPHQIEKVKRFPGKVEACRTYIYDEKHLQVRFAHAFFLNNKLVSATDGHLTTCSLWQWASRLTRWAGHIVHNVCTLLFRLFLPSVCARDGRDSVCACG